MLYATPEAIRAEVARVLESYGRGPGTSSTSGHGIQPGVDPENVAAMVAAVHELSPNTTAEVGELTEFQIATFKDLVFRRVRPQLAAELERIR